MDSVSRYFLTLLSCALSGAVPGEAEFSPEEWDALFSLAREQKVLPLVFEALCRTSAAKALPQFPGLKREVITQVMLQTQKTAQLHRVLKALTDAGLHPVVVKGILCRRLYPKPDHRPSSDEDLLIPPEESLKCHEILTALGLFTEADPGSDAYEIPYHQKNGPLYIELHRQLFPPESEAYGGWNRFFAHAREHSIIIEGIPTLEPTGHLFYLILHALKHFLHSGFGIRQVCDIVLFAKAYEIHWDALLESCRRVRADRFAAAIFAIGEKHLVLGPVPEGFRDIPVEEMPMLLDLLDAGIYGGATESRRHSSSITLEAAVGSRKNSLLASLFPPAAQLEGRYPYLKGRPFLLPLAWASRMGRYLKAKKSSTSAAEALKIGKERVELLKYYEILP